MSDKLFEDLKDKLISTGGQYDLVTIEKAYELAKNAHNGQMRSSGDPYISHPVEVAKILVNLGMDNETITAALLHDVVEDTEYTLDQIRDMFGDEVALLVDGVTKLGQVPLSTKAEEQAENVRKMFMAMSKDIRVIIIKLSDRLHNMRTLQYRPEQKRRDKSKETLDIYAPIAHRLGIRAMKEELEDLALYYLDPVGYKDIQQSLKMHEKDRAAFLKEIREQIYQRVSQTIKNVRMEGRVKSIHGIYRKMYMQNHSFDQIYDVYAVRIIVEEVNDCYNALGIVHDMFRPIPGRFKDYISTPKPNMYQSLHTTVLSKQGIPFEVQIRTWEMHQTAEYGIAAHWKYKLGLSGTQKNEDRLAWIRKILENHADAVDVEDIVNSIKTDLTPDEVYVLTPKGDVKSLPSGSTVIDFAYAIHSAVGNRMTGAKVNGKIVPIDYKVKTGDIIDILTTSQQGKGPSRDWLKIVRTNEAKSKIRSWFKKERREENIVEGKAEVEREFRRNKCIFSPDEYRVFIEAVAQRQRCATVDDFYAAIGYGGIILSKLMPHIKEEYNKLEKAKSAEEPVITDYIEPKKSSDGVIVEGIDNCLIKFSRCCNPLPGDEIIGFITRGHGVSIHKRDCVNIPADISTAEEPDRFVKARWNKEVRESFKSTLQIVSFDREGLLADVTVQLSNMHVMIHSANAREQKDKRCIINITISVNGVEHLKNVISRLSKISGVLSVERAAVS